MRHYRLFILSLWFLFFSFPVFSQTPEAINYQAIVRDQDGDVLVGDSVDFHIYIYNGLPSSGTLVYLEKHLVETDSFGMANISLGMGVLIQDSTGNVPDFFSNINWSNGAYYLQIRAEIDNSGNYIIMGSSQLLSVPYALYAKSSGTGSQPGPTGPSGLNGSIGLQGPTGLQGPIGPQGSMGIKGATGLQGFQGSTGSQGLPGGSGAQGITGSQGPDGNAGAQGPQGSTGAIGQTGTQGPTGDQGIDGNAGVQGAQGPTGNQGSQGATGNQGAQGSIGSQGTEGSTGNQGPDGNTGAQGPQGSTGAIGQTGTQGPTGDQGIDGNQGAIGQTGAKGPTGDQGIDGNQGAIGQTGAQGPTGAQGISGNQGLSGLQGITGAQGISGNQGLSGLQGITGAQGISGNQGLSGLQGITGAQGISGNQGLSGLQGITGAQGISGNQGSSGLQGVSGSKGLTGSTGAPYGLAGSTGETLFYNGTDWTATNNLYNNGTHIGIGTTNPLFGLDVKTGDDDNVSARFRGNIQVNQFDATNRAYGFVSTNSNSALFGGNLRLDDAVLTGNHIGYSKGTNDRGAASMQIVNPLAGTGYFKFLNATETDDDTYTISEVMRIDQSGNLGIGNDSPQEKLDVWGNIRFGEGINSTLKARIGIKHMTYPQTFISLPGNGAHGTNYYHYLHIYRDMDSLDDRNYHTRYWEDDPTINIWEKNDPVQGYPHLRMIMHSTGFQAASRYSVNGKSLSINHVLGGDVIILNDTFPGNVGIATTLPTERIDVNGNIRMRGEVGNTASSGYLPVSNSDGVMIWTDPSLLGTLGVTGATGPSGNAGTSGLPGSTGAIGKTGSTGAPYGLAGTTGQTLYHDGTDWTASSNLYNNGSQLGVGAMMPDPSAKLEVSSTTQGFLPPRMTQAERDAISLPANGLIIFNTSTNCINYYSSGAWYKLCGTL